eukprot:1741176-Pyramimonas_sp.AAC.1
MDSAGVITALNVMNASGRKTTARPLTGRDTTRRSTTQRQDVATGSSDCSTCVTTRQHLYLRQGVK